VDDRLVEAHSAVNKRRKYHQAGNYEHRAASVLECPSFLDFDQKRTAARQPRLPETLDQARSNPKFCNP
jgi:hypothetical protein